MFPNEWKMLQCVTVGHKTTLQTNIQLAFVLVTFVLYAKSLVHGLLVNILEKQS